MATEPQNNGPRTQVYFILSLLLLAGALVWTFDTWRNAIKQDVAQAQPENPTTQTQVEVVEPKVAAPSEPQSDQTAVNIEPIPKVMPAPEENTITEPQQPKVVETVTIDIAPAKDTQVDEAVDTATALVETLGSTDDPKASTIEAPDLENAPVFDVVRVDPAGSAVIAGKAEPNTEVSVLGNDLELGTVTTGADGNFVALLDVPTGEDPTVLRLLSREKDGEQTRSADSILIMPIEPQAEAAPMIIAAEETTVEVVQAPPVDIKDTTEISAQLTLDTIDYSDTGAVVFSGRGTSSEGVRIYVDNVPQVLGKVENGRWSLTLPNVDQGLYTVRVDALDATGQVKSRVETPFKREIPKSTDLGPVVTIQPGFTLWQLAREKYGAGIRYVQIYQANKSAIKDPDLIYPGQVFNLPDQ